MLFANEQSSLHHNKNTNPELASGSDILESLYTHFTRSLGTFEPGRTRAALKRSKCQLYFSTLAGLEHLFLEIQKGLEAQNIGATVGAEM